jgi:hypothetical protein
MSDDPFPIDAVAPEVIAGVRLLPVVHERVDLASVVRMALEFLQPAQVAVELPTTLAEAAHRAVGRLPRISVVISEEPGEDALVWIVAPGDPIVEALRWANDNDRPTRLIDPDIRYRTRHHDPVPDPDAMWRIGLSEYFGTLAELAAASKPSPEDTLREQGMAHHLHHAAGGAEGPILAVIGSAHAVRVAEFLRSPTAAPLAKQIRTRVDLRHLHPDSLAEILQDFPMAHGIFELLRKAALPVEPPLTSTLSTRVERVVEGMKVITRGGGSDTTARATAVVQRAAHRASQPTPWGRCVDRRAIGVPLWNIASASLREQTRAETTVWQRRLFHDFAHRHSRIQGRLVPGLYEWVVAARGVADDNFAWEIFDVLRSYPWQKPNAELPTARIDGEMLDLGTRTVRFRRRFLRIKQRPVAVPVRRRPQPEDPSDWLDAFDGEGICSYPPEDVVIEDFGHFLQRKALSNLAAETSRTEPFTTSMLDGIDLRETLLKLHEDRIYVREHGRAPGDAGSVVVIFDPDVDGSRFPYLTTWLGEHQQESDMAFYSTDPSRQIVGPGIMRASYGGFMLTYPPGRLFDVWRDPDYGTARSKAEVLTMAAIDYSREKLVIHVAAQPPSEVLHRWAGQQAKKLVHIPIGTLSPTSLNRIQGVHILMGRKTREVAPDYIW